MRRSGSSHSPSSWTIRSAATSSRTRCGRPNRGPSRSFSGRHAGCGVDYRGREARLGPYHQVPEHSPQSAGTAGLRDREAARIRRHRQGYERRGTRRIAGPLSARCGSPRCGQNGAAAVRYFSRRGVLETDLSRDRNIGIVAAADQRCTRSAVGVETPALARSKDLARVGSVSPCPTGTFTRQDAPSLSWRCNVPANAPPACGRSPLSRRLNLAARPCRKALPVPPDAPPQASSVDEYV